ncbi:MAG: OmpA family protein [Rhizomicrobium sp.]
MKLAVAFGVCVLLLGPLPAAAQSYPGEEVTVNPSALGSGILLYPGGKYGRQVGRLLQPGERRAAPIRLHMPVKRAALPRRPRPVLADTVTIPAEIDSAPLPPRRTAPPPRQTAAAQPPVSDPSLLPEDSAARLFGAAPPPSAPSTLPPKPAAARSARPVDPATAAIPFTMGGPAPARPPQRTASATPPPARTTTPPAAGLKKASVIPFAEGASSPASADVGAIHALATSLNAALNAGAARVQLEAYGGPRGDKSSDSRRLSLKRALVVRELLIEDGVPSEKIDVRAMGGADDGGAADRVDVFVRA